MSYTQKDDGNDDDDSDCGDVNDNCSGGDGGDDSNGTIVHSGVLNESLHNMQVIISMQPLCFDFHFNFQKGAFVFLELSWILFWRAAWCQYIKGRNGMNS